MTSLQSRRNENHATLDLFSTSPTSALQERMASTSPCSYHAPFFAYQTEQKTWHITQGNCHHWDCPRCGLGRAKQEYGRMVEGCRLLAEKHELYFITITCRGKEISHEYAEENYGKWTNRLLDACRSQAKRKGREWHYVQVTERQKRMHPHSHFITTYAPPITSRQIVRKQKNRRAENTGKSYPRTYGLIGLKARSKSRGWASNTTLLVSKEQRAHQGMSQNTYLNPPFSRLIGLKDGSASGTVKAFQMRRNVKPTP